MTNPTQNQYPRQDNSQRPSGESRESRNASAQNEREGDRNRQQGFPKKNPSESERDSSKQKMNQNSR